VINFAWEFTAMLIVVHLFHSSIIIFQHNLQTHGRICPRVAQVEKFLCTDNRTVSFTTIHKELLPLHHSFFIGDLPSVASVAQTYSKIPAFITCILYALFWPGQYHFQRFAPFSDTISPCYSISKHLLSTASKFQGGKCVFPKKTTSHCALLHREKFLM
jgi:hypothetical protein